MLIKVCGLKTPETIQNIEDLNGVDYSGFIFYDKSPRYVGNLNYIPKKSAHIKRVGVFVNPTIEEVKSRIQKYSLDYIQLHGEESNAFCERIKKLGAGVIKALSISTAADIEKTKEYSEENIDLFLLDTKTSNYGGSGEKFDWEIIKHYSSKVPFLLSGGVSVNDIENIIRIDNKLLKGIDLNSRFELEPGEKNIALVAEFIQKLKITT